MGTDGFAFVEFAHPEPLQLHRLFRLMGFAKVARHRSKAITVYRQGDVDYLVNEEPNTHAARFAALHGPCAASMGFRALTQHMLTNALLASVRNQQTLSRARKCLRSLHQLNKKTGSTRSKSIARTRSSLAEERASRSRQSRSHNRRRFYHRPCNESRLVSRSHAALKWKRPRGAKNGNFRNGDWTAEAIEERKWLRSLVQSFAKTGTTE
jgi:hypothetical protein